MYSFGFCFNVGLVSASFLLWSCRRGQVVFGMFLEGSIAPGWAQMGDKLALGIRRARTWRRSSAWEPGPYLMPRSQLNGHLCPADARLLQLSVVPQPLVSGGAWARTQHVYVCLASPTVRIVDWHQITRFPAGGPSNLGPGLPPRICMLQGARDAKGTNHAVHQPLGSQPGVRGARIIVPVKWASLCQPSFCAFQGCAGHGKNESRRQQKGHLLEQLGRNDGPWAFRPWPK